MYELNSGYITNYKQSYHIAQYLFEIHFSLRLVLIFLSVLYSLFWVIRPEERQVVKTQLARLKS